MNKENVVKISLFFVTFLAFIALPSFATASLVSNTTTAPVNRFQLNFTQINATLNVTQVNFTLPTGIGFVGTTSYTNSSFTGTISGQTIYFGDNTTNSSGTTNWFAFNVSSSSSGLFNITVTEVINDTPFYTMITNVTLNVTNGTIRMNISLVNYTYDGSSLLMNFTGNKSMLTPVGGGTIIDNITFKMYRNGTAISTNYTNMTTNGTGVISYTNDATAGTYLFIFNTSGDANYSENSTSVTLKISQATPTMDIFINNSDANSTTIYPAAVEIRGNATLGNATFVSSPDFNVYVINFTNSSPAVALNASGNPAVITRVLGNASYQINYTTAGNQNFTTATNDTLFLNVAKGTLSISLSGTNSTYPTSPSVTGTRNSSVGDSDVNYTLWRNNTLANSANGTSPAADVLVQANTTFVYKFNATGGANWTVNATGLTMSINVSKGALNLSLSIPNVTYFSNTVATVTEANIGDADINYTLYFLNTSSAGMVNNSSALGSESMSYVKLLGANESNAYLFVLNTSNTSGLMNWTANASGLMVPVIVSKGTTALALNISPSTSVTNPTQTNATGYNCPAQGASDVNCTLWRNNVYLASANASNTSELVALGVGSWVYNYSTSGGSNWTSNYTTLTLTVSAASVVPSSSSSGGPVTPTTTITVTLTKGNANITIPSVAAGNMASVTVAKYEDVDFRQVNISVSNSVNNIKIAITKLLGEPASVTHTIEGKVYHYVQIDKTNFADSDLSKVYIKFVVSKTWLTDNGVDKTNVSLYRWTDKWTELTTIYLSEDSSEAFYQAESPGFSYFLIGTKGGELTVTPVVCTESWTCAAWSACVNGQQTRTCTDANNCGTIASKPAESQTCVVQEEVKATDYSWAYYTVAAIIIIVIGAVLFVFRKKITPKLSKVPHKKNH